VESASLGDVVVVGHSLGGLTVPGVVARLGTRVRGLVLAAAFIPPQGSTVVDTLGGPLAPLARYGPRMRSVTTIPSAAARLTFLNAMPRERQKLALSRRYPESAGVIFERVDRSDLPAEVPRTWIMTLRDRALSLRQQRRCIESLGGVDTLLCIDSCHDLMYSKPEQVAAILLELCVNHTGHTGTAEPRHDQT
jgi:pimeloyl-ACP methyl ester carboxylesterase